MTEPDDDFAHWLAPHDSDYLPPPPGTFDQVYRAAGRRRWAKAGTATLSLAAILIAGVVVTQQVVGVALPIQPADSTPATPSVPSHTPAGASTPPSSPATLMPPPSRSVNSGPATDHPPSTVSSVPVPTTPAPCTDHEVSLSAHSDPNSYGMSQFRMLLIVTNTADVTCTIAGTPEVIFADSRHAALTDAFPPVRSGPLINLRPSGQAHVAIRQISDPPAVVQNCTPIDAAGYLVTLPGQLTAQYVAQKMATQCSNIDGLPTMEPFIPGP